MHDIWFFRLDNPKCAPDIACASQEIHAAPISSKWNEPHPLIKNTLRVFVNSGRNHNVESVVPSCSSHRKKVGGKKPILRDKVKNLGHDLTFGPKCLEL